MDEPLVWYEGPGTGATANKNWLYADHLGSIIATANASGSASAGSGTVNTYGPFGESAQTTPDNNRFGYTGQQQLKGLGLYYYKARIYSPALGRFLQTDPTGVADDLNLYGYVGNGAINARDPSGLAAVVSKYGNDVYIVLTVVYTGPNAIARAAVADAAIQNAWTGNFGGLNVRTIVASVVANTPGSLAAAQGANMTTVNFVPSGHASLTGGTRSNQTLTVGNWNDSASPLEYAHEAGHIMGLKDRYTSPPYTIDRGWTGNLMAQLPGIVEPRNISGVLANAGCGTGCAGNVIPTTGGMTSNSPGGASVPGGK